MNKRKKGWLIVNEFLNGEKFQEIYQWLVEAAKKIGIDLQVLTNAQLLVKYNLEGTKVVKYCSELEKKPDGRLNRSNSEIDNSVADNYMADNAPDFIIYWDKDIPLAKAIEEQGIPMFNCADAIAACDDKGLTHRLLAAHHIPMPITIPVPMTFAGIGYNSFDFLDSIEETLAYPFVLKECFGSFGAQVYLIHTRKEAEEKLQELEGKPMLIQEYIKTSVGRDIRINMVGEEAVTAMLRYNDNDFRANITNGGSMKPYTPNEAQIALARKVCEILKLDFAGVDIMFGEKDEPILCEVNSNAHFKNIYDCTGVNVAEKIMEYVYRKF